MTPLARYLVLQIPGWVAIVLGGAVLVRFDFVGWALVGGVLAVWVVKDMALYPFLRPHLFVDRGPPLGELVGKTGEVATPIAPDGYVRLGNERWRAINEEGAPLAVGRKVRIVGSEGLTLIVTPANDEV